MNFLFDTQKAADLVRERMPWLDWDSPTLSEYIAWHKENGLACMSEDGKILAIARKVDRPEEAKEYYRHDPFGKILWIECLVAPRKFWRTLIRIAAFRLGQFDFVAFARPKHNFRVRLYPAHLFA